MSDLRLTAFAGDERGDGVDRRKIGQVQVRVLDLYVELGFDEKDQLNGENRVYDAFLENELIGSQIRKSGHPLQVLSDPRLSFVCAHEVPAFQE